jgi:hypothetical protein
MKKKISIVTILGAFAIMIAGALIMSSCEGPAGPAGTNGTNGVDGTDGTEGVAGNAVCLACHTLGVKNAITAQWETSAHGIGANVGYAGGRNDCAKCHSDQGFVQTVYTGGDTTAANIPLPQEIQCETCHDFHPSLDFENEPNSAIRQMADVTLMADPTVTVGYDNMEANLCMNCHQARRAPADDADATAMVYVSPHYGPHHGPQANTINGVNGYEFRMDLGTTGAHTSGADCVSCHMQEGDGTVGGHTWIPGEASCTACHSDGPPDSDVEAKLTELGIALYTAGMIDADGHTIENVSYQADSVGALWNFLTLKEDASMGIHNPGYADALLDASIDALK